jgi:hypothetical protein
LAYQVPATLVYEQLASTGGVSSTTPNLETCVIGPAYNVLSYVAGSTTSLIDTAATSATTGVASMTSGSNALTFTVQVPFSVGDTLQVPGAGASGATLSSTVASVAGYVATLNATASTTVTNVTVTKAGQIVNDNITNTFNIPGQLPGQVVDPTTIQIYLNNALVETLATNFTGSSGNNALTIAAASSPGVVTASSTQVTGVTNAALFVVGDPITIAGAGASGATLSTTIAEIIGQTVTLATAAGTSVASATLVKSAISNVNSTTSTLRVEAGDEVEFFYTNTSSVAETFTSTVLSVVSLTGTITNININDVLPTDLSKVTTVGTASTIGASTLTVASATGFSAGDTIIIHGAAAGGADLYTVIGGITGSQFTGLNPVIPTATTVGQTVTRVATLTLRTRKAYNNLLLPQTLNSYTNYNTSSTATTGQFTIEPAPQTVYGTVISASVNAAYSALRTDLSGAIQTIATVDDLEGTLGAPTNLNPLSLGVQLALANTTTQINALAVTSNDLEGYTSALEMLEGATMYALIPLTQDQSILEAFQQHVDQMSTAANAAWRMALVNTAIPTSQDIGQYTATNVNANGGNNTITVVQGNYVLTASNATFLSDGVTPGDIVNVTAGTGSPSPIGTMQVLQVLSNQQISVQTTGTATGVSYYITRTLTKAQQAAAVAAVSTTYNDARMVHVQPDTAGISINGVVTNLPGYYLACTAGGLIAGLPVQQGLTNIAVAGISTISNSNFYFTRAQLDTMAAAGTFLFVQATQGAVPYIRHELTTNMSVLQYREVQQVKNIDFLAYYFVEILQGFIGKWNITPDSLNTLRQTITAGGKLLAGQKQPKIGAPLLTLTINSLVQDTANLDNVDCYLTVTIGTPMNYINIYLTV